MAASSRRPWSEASIIGTRGWLRKILPGWVVHTEVGQGLRLAVLGLPPLGSGIHTEQVGLMTGVLGSEGPLRQTSGPGRSSEHLNGLSGRDRAEPRLNVEAGIQEARDALLAG